MNYCAKFFAFNGFDPPVFPSYETIGSSGMDLRAYLPLSEALTIQPMCRGVIPTGLGVDINQGFEGQVRSRSGLAAKHGVFVLNSPGTIDSDFSGHIKVILFNSGDTPFTVVTGDRIAQMVFSPVAYAESTSSNRVRGTGGFGSTGIS